METNNTIHNRPLNSNIQFDIWSLFPYLDFHEAKREYDYLSRRMRPFKKPFDLKK